VVALADLKASEPSTRPRGAAHAAFRLLFSLPFDRTAVADYREPQIPSAPASNEVPSGSSTQLRTSLGYASLGLAAVGLGAGVALSLASRTGHSQQTCNQKQMAVQAIEV
jgi:hypothetical protein